ncbi:MAG TPA: CU044_5270 family protein [Gaiellaceae bacterium]|nr:CU044_5270 family protein [Gaiellaceae bacterium]
MSDLDLVRDLYPERTPDAAARDRVRDAVAARTTGRRALALRRGRLVPALGTAGLACAVAAVLVVVLAGTSATVNASAARLFRQAARAAAHERSIATLGPGEYLYTKSVSTNMSTTGGTRPDGTTWEYSALVPQVREIWLAANDTGWLHETGGTPTFLSDRDRQMWIADGRPNMGTGVSTTRLGGGPSGTVMPSIDLPADPDALYTRLYDQANGNGNGVYPEMFTLIGDALRENYTTPSQRAALYEVAARLPGIQLAGRTVDSVGRPALAVGMETNDGHAMNVLLFDPTTYALLGEQSTVLAGNPEGYPAGAVVGEATYLEQRVVNAVPASVVSAAKN